MIVKNSADVLERCLKSVKGADEIVIVDTGSEDNTMEIARRYTDKVYEYWGCNEGGKKDGLFASFADARNKSLSYCTSSHILTIDADEYLEEGGMEKLKKFDGDALSIRCISERTGEEHRQPRFYINHKDVYWKGAAHNYLTISGGIRSEVVIYYGANSQKKKDPDRTMRILQREVKKHGKPRETYYLGKEYQRRGWYKKAIKTFRRYVVKSNFPAEKADAFIQLARCYAAMGKLNHTINAAMAAFNLNPQCKEVLRLIGDLSPGVNRLKFKHLAANATNDGVLFIRNDNRIKITMLSDYDWAGSGFRLMRAIRDASGGKLDIEQIVMRSGQASPHFKMETGPSVDQIGWDVAQERINQSDIIHYKGDVPYNRKMHQLKIPKDKKIIYQVVGSHFRNKYLKDAKAFKGDFLAYGTPDLHVDGWTYMPNVWQTFDYRWKRGKKFRIVHVPSNPDKKGTELIIRAIKILSRRTDIEFVCEMNVSHEKSKELKKDASIYIDQMVVGAYGNAALEAMAYGVPVVCWGESDLTHSPKERTAESLAQLLSDMMDWDKLEKLSVETFEGLKNKHGDMAKKWIDVYLKLTDGS